MSLSHHRTKIRNQIRKEQINGLITKARGEVMEFNVKQGYCLDDHQSQDSIIDTLQKAVWERQSINGEAILKFICRHEGEFSPGFRNQFTKLIITHFRTSKLWLISLRELICKSKEIEVVNELSINSLVRVLFRQNWDEESEKTNNIEEIVELVCILLKKSSKAQELEVLKQYQTQIQELGFKSITYIKFIYLALAANVYSPSEAAIKHYLEHDESQIDYECYFSYVCSIMIAYYRQHPFGSGFLAWLNRRFNEYLFPDYLLKELLAFISKSLQQGRISQATLAQIAECCFDGLCLVVRERAFDSRLQGLRVMESILNQCDGQVCCALIERNSLLEMIACLLNISMDNQLTLSLLVLLVWILKSNLRYQQQAEQLGIFAVLNYYSCSANVRVAEISQLILHTFELS